MALVGSRVELDADEVRGQAERAGCGVPWGSRLARRVGRAVLHAKQRPTGPGRAARSPPEPPWTLWAFAEPF